MERKLIKHGPSSLVISIPAKWVKAHHLKKGEVISLKDKGSSLIITPTLDKQKKQNLSLNLDNMDRSSFLKSLVSAYIKGYDEINITYTNVTIIDYKINKKVPISKIIQRYLPRFIGFAIVSQEKNKYVLKEVSKSTAEDFEVIFRRIFYLMQGFAKEIKEGLQKDKMLTPEEAYERHDNIVKFIFYCLRILNKKEIMQQQSQHLYTIIVILDKITDYFRYCVYDMHEVQELSQEGKHIISEIITIFPILNNLYFQFDVKNIQQFTQKRFKIKQKIANVQLKNQKEIILITRFSTILELSQEVIKEIYILKFI